MQRGDCDPRYAPHACNFKGKDSQEWAEGMLASTDTPHSKAGVIHPSQGVTELLKMSRVFRSSSTIFVLFLKYHFFKAVHAHHRKLEYIEKEKTSPLSSH